MAKGVAVKFQSYQETIPKVLKIIKFDSELKKHDKIIIKPSLISGSSDLSSKPEFIESILKFCIENKNPGAEVFIAEGCNGANTNEVFEERGFAKLAEKYGVSLVDLNQTYTEEIGNSEFLKFESIHYPKILLESFIISAPKLAKNEEKGISSSLDNMLGAYPSKHYQSFFSSTKNKIAKHLFKFQVHDILKCKMPELAIIDASEQGFLLVGQPLEMDKQAAKSLGLNWQNIQHLRLIEESFSPKKKAVDNLIN